MTAVASLPVRIASADQLGDEVRTLTLEPENGRPLPAFSPGSHVVVRLPGDDKVRNPYSLACSPWSTSSYRIAVRRIPGGRGSTGLHEGVAVGDRLEIEPPMNFFPPHAAARRHVMVAGGIGITPFISYVHVLRRAGVPFELHYAFRDAATAPLLDELRELCGGCLFAYEDPTGSQIVPALRDDVLARQPLGTHLSICGPAPMIEAVLTAARLRGWPETRLHTERFVLDRGTMDPFTVELARSGRALTVPQDVTLLEALEAADVAPPSLCRLGFCGECRTRLVAGTPDHRDQYLTEAEQGSAVMPCVSRCAGDGPLVLDL